MADARGSAAADLEAFVLRSVFTGAQPSPHPTLVLLSGSSGAGAGRAIARLRQAHDGDLVPVASDDLQAFHPRYVEPRFRESAAGQQELSQAAASWLQACIAHARENRVSLLLEGGFRSPSTTLAVAHRFADSGYQVHIVVVAARDDESLLAATSRGLRRLQHRTPAHFMTPAENERSLADVDALVAASAADPAVDLLSVIGRRGQSALDARRTDVAAMAGASAAFRAACSERMSALEATQWLSELRHATEYARSFRTAHASATESLIALHELAIRRVVPELPLPAGSDVVRIQQERLVADLASLRRAHGSTEDVDIAAPVATPSGPGISISR